LQLSKSSFHSAEAGALEKPSKTFSIKRRAAAIFTLITGLHNMMEVCFESSAKN
jgi:hypothetical protein